MERPVSSRAQSVLVDQHHNVRNIYSTGLFSAQLVLNDIETLLIETKKQTTTRELP